MRHYRILPVVAGAAIVSLLALAPSQAGRDRSGTGFDPLFAQGASCAPARPGPPPLLAALVQARQPAAASGDAPPPLYETLGKLHLPVSTANGQAQAYFDQGLRLSFAFNHAEAVRAFRAARRFDPDCAMCYWGEALALGPNINAPMFPEAVAPAHAAAQQALLLAGRARPYEQALIRAVAQRYAGSVVEDRSHLDRAYADAMQQAARAFPSNDTILALYAESLMDLAPWDYWQAGGARPKGRTADMIAALETVLKRNPTHPGAAHFYIHAVEASSTPERALPYARLLARQIPGAGHIVHMPSHIYYRLGMYRESLAANADAIAADERYFQLSSSDPLYKGAYYPHNIHFVMTSALMGGDGRVALDAADKLDKSLPDQLVAQFAALQPVKGAPYFANVQFSSPDTLIALSDPGPQLVLVQAMWRYARAVGFARKGMATESRREIDAMAALERTADFQPFAAWDVPAQAIVTTARHVAAGRLAEAQGDQPRALAAYRQAVAVQDSLPYMEPPYWYYPARQTLGAALLRAGQPEEAETMFRSALARSPGNGWALRGLLEVYRQRGDEVSLKLAQQRFEAAWLGKEGLPPLAAL